MRSMFRSVRSTTSPKSSAIRTCAREAWWAALTIPAWANSRRSGCRTNFSAGTTRRLARRQRWASTRRRSWRNSMFATLKLAMEGGVATITLDRPEARNALNERMCEELLAAAKAIGDDEMKVVFVRGAGPAFCAGADIKERAGKTREWVRARRLKAFAAYQGIESLPMPVIGVVHGAVLGAGIEIAAICDFVVATPEALFGTPEALRGTVGATQRLPRLIGKRLAKDLMFTGRRLTADEALAAGFVSRIFKKEELEERLEEIGKNIAAAPVGAMRLAKRCIDQGGERDPQGALEVELAAIDEQLASGVWMGKE